jgi:HPt (histidine-containing phosphotransfer) domain-containing protein
VLKMAGDAARETMNTSELTNESGGMAVCCGRQKDELELTSVNGTTPRMSPRSFGEMVNLQELMERVDHDSELLREIFDLFCEEFPVLHSDLRQAILSGSLPCIQSKAHALKGMFANLAVTQAALVAAEIEQMARSGDRRGATVAFTRLDEEVLGLLPCVKRFLAGTPQ